MSLQADRRSFLAATAGTLAGALSPGESRADVTPPRDAGAASTAISIQTIAEAEKLVAVQYTAAERELLSRSLGDQIRWSEERRRVPLGFADAPALVFRPDSSPGRKASWRVPLPKAGAPGGEEDVAYAPVTQLAAWLAARKVSSEELVKLSLARLERHGPALCCVVTLIREAALAEARALDAERARGRSRGPLHGVPFGVKDLLDTAGVATTFGAEPFRGRVPDRDAVVVQRLRRAGAVLVAKLSLGELAMDDTWFGGMTRNPWLLAEGSCGSSAGSAAATAAGLVPFALGSETLGSIISPSMRCGVTGLRPTFGRVARTGAMPLAWSLDKLGPLARTVDDAMLALAAIHGADPGDPSSADAPLDYQAGAGVKGMKVGYFPEHFSSPQAVPADREALEAVRALGVELVPLALPELPYDSLVAILLAEAAASFEELSLSGKDDRLTRQTVAAWPNVFRAARFISAVDYVQADRLRRRVQAMVRQLYAAVEVIIDPSLVGPMLVITNFTGHPSLTLRTGFLQIDRPRGEDVVLPSGDQPLLSAPRRVPHGVTLYGRLWEEGTVARLGRALEQARGVWRERPTLT